MADWKDRLGVLYSTNPDYQYQTNDKEEEETLEPAEQNLRISLSKKQRAGKEVTLITGDQRAKVKEILLSMGYKKTKG